MQWLRMMKIAAFSVLPIAVLSSLENAHAQSANMVLNGNFDNGNAAWEEPGWWAGGTGDSGVDALGRHCTTVTTLGTDDWGAQLRQFGKTYVTGGLYRVNLRAWSTTPISLQLGASEESTGFVWVFGSNFEVDAPLDGEGQEIELNFMADADADNNGIFRILMGGGAVPLGETVCFDDITMINLDGNGAEPLAAAVQVNQVGYLPKGYKRAAFALAEDDTDTDTPRPWALMQGGLTVATGSTVPHSNTPDRASGDVVHNIDFSFYEQAGQDYTLTVYDNDTTLTSEAFDLSYELYSEMKYDALSYFYHNRSGTPILAEVVGETWARPVGHAGDSAVETIECLQGSEGCYTVDASGGWYDAGDQGKYVVNGGISVWTMLNQYERTRFQGRTLDDFADGTMQLPEEERTNGMSDLLDEARWEIEWFFKMQVPLGRPNAGAVYHKMHDLNWTGLPTAPHEDPETRYVHPVSTAATLNVAAVGAQCFRVYRRFDFPFALECLIRAKAAYHAAKTMPIALAPTISNGGGAYWDTDVSDEFYWAATELFLSTGQQRFADDMIASPIHGVGDAVRGSFMSWLDTGTLGVISMATVGDHNYFASEQMTQNARSLITTMAEVFSNNVANEAYGTPFSVTRYPWGSNSNVVSNMIVMALANDFSCGDVFADSLLQSADYLFGRNPLGKSYVSGYGEAALQNPHHRFWANAANSAFPIVPAGALSGGPNSAIEDPISASLFGCPAQRCYVDDIEAYSVNEVAINWNASLAWITAYLDEYAHRLEKGKPGRWCH